MRKMQKRLLRKKNLRRLKKNLNKKKNLLKSNRPQKNFLKVKSRSHKLKKPELKKFLSKLCRLSNLKSKKRQS